MLLSCRCCHKMLTHHNEYMNEPRDVCDSLSHAGPYLVLTELLVFCEESSKPLFERPMLNKRLKHNECEGCSRAADTRIKGLI